jgi:hypothetical protein
MVSMSEAVWRTGMTVPQLDRLLVNGRIDLSLLVGNRTPATRPSIRLVGPVNL